MSCLHYSTAHYFESYWFNQFDERLLWKWKLFWKYLDWKGTLNRFDSSQHLKLCSWPLTLFQKSFPKFNLEFQRAWIKKAHQALQTTLPLNHLKSDCSLLSWCKSCPRVPDNSKYSKTFRMTKFQLKCRILNSEFESRISWTLRIKRLDLNNRSDFPNNFIPKSAKK